MYFPGVSHDKGPVSYISSKEIQSGFVPTRQIMERMSNYLRDHRSHKWAINWFE